jgi:hypothetical protein
MRTFVATLLFAPVLALAGPYDQPYVIITSDTAPTVDPNLRPVLVSRVDGENVMNNLAVVAPGKRKVTLDLAPRKGFSATQEVLELDAKACTRYTVSAKLDNAVGQKWAPVIRRTEPIGDCEAKFKVTGAAR